MKYSEAIFDRLGAKDPDEAFKYLLNTLQDSIRTWDYFVNWSKVMGNLKDIEVRLHLLDYLIGKADIEKEFAQLLRTYPEVLETIPILLACREAQFKVLTSFENQAFKYKDFSFTRGQSLSEAQITAAVEFAAKSGFLDKLKSKRLTSVVDYVIGVEVGLDSNGRKNRGGSTMEDIVKSQLELVCERNGFEFMEQANAKKLKDKWQKFITVDVSSRTIDFAVLSRNRLYLIECNFYGGGGSKLKATAGEYRTMATQWSSGGHVFIWITDGVGWRTAERPLREAFDEIDFIMNLNMVSRGLLEDVVSGKVDD